MDETKAAIRHAMRRRRRALTPTEMAAAGAAVADAVLALAPVRDASLLLAYVDTDSEIPTDALIASALASGKRVFLPRLDGERMVFAEHRLGAGWASGDGDAGGSTWRGGWRAYLPGIHRGRQGHGRRCPFRA